MGPMDNNIWRKQEIIWKRETTVEHLKVQPVGEDETGS
jgi:hypothetical protein